MTLSKQSTVLALSAIAALALEVGCGSNGNSNNKSMNARHNLRAVQDKKVMSKHGGVGTKAAAGIDGMKQEETLLQAPDKKTFDELANDDKYELQTVKVYYNYSNAPKESMSVSDFATISHVTTPKPGDVLNVTPNSPFGKMTLDTDAVARTVDIPMWFNKTANMPLDRNTNTSNIMLSSQFGLPTANQLNDKFDLPLDQDASIVRILNTVQPTVSGNDKVYVGDANGTKIYVRFLDADAQVLRIWVSVDEKLPDAKNASMNASAETITRNIYLDYKITPITAAPAPTTGAGADAAPAAPAADPAATNPQ